MKESQIQTMTDQIVRIFKAYEGQGTKTWTYDVAAHDLQYQIGNLSKCVLQLKEFRYHEGQSRAEITKKLADELADILAEVLFIAHELDIDVTQAWDAMIASDEAKIASRRVAD